MEQNQEPRNKLIHIWITPLLYVAKNIQWRNDNLFNSAVGKTRQPHAKK